MFKKEHTRNWNSLIIFTKEAFPNFSSIWALPPLAVSSQKFLLHICMPLVRGSLESEPLSPAPRALSPTQKRSILPQGMDRLCLPGLPLLRKSLRQSKRALEQRRRNQQRADATHA